MDVILNILVAIFCVALFIGAFVLLAVVFYALFIEPFRKKQEPQSHINFTIHIRK